MLKLLYLSCVLTAEVILSTISRRYYRKYLNYFFNYKFRLPFKPSKTIFIPHGHRWEMLSIKYLGAMAPSGRAYPSTYVVARCKGCGTRKHKVFYNSHLNKSQCRRWL
ncbi:hypothetical protein [Rouxiella sp. WC2420]|uniref:Secreted protein n=1 Tax=Rouxiella sp. WC2420 TaxID=3234145 RepID=A0AB39VKG8_9GAMM